MRDFRELKVWQRSMTVARQSYRLTDHLPLDEKYGLVSQIRRSAVSIPSNIAEGSGRDTPRESMRFLRIAYGSACELETQLLIARETGKDSSGLALDIARDLEEIRRMIYALIQQLKTDT
jgi:four helix bundle protein